MNEFHAVETQKMGIQRVEPGLIDTRSGQDAEGSREQPDFMAELGCRNCEPSVEMQELTALDAWDSLDLTLFA
jgi:hypothetical protein